MTVEEMLQLLLDKIDSNHAETKADIMRLEAKIDANHAEAMSEIKELKADVAEIKTDVQYLKRQDDIDSLAVNGAYNGIKDLHTKFDKQISSVKLLDKNYISLHQRVDKVEDDVEDIKARLDKAS